MSIRFYTTAGCHLCEQAYTLLVHLSSRYDITIEAIESGDDEALLAEYGLHIPVLVFADNSRLFWPFTLEQIEQQLQQG